MTLDGVLTLGTLLVAAYALLPRGRVLELHLLVGPFEKIFVAICAVGILYFQFFPFFASIGLVPRLGLMNRFGLAPQSISFLIVLLCALAIFANIRLKKLSPAKAEAFRDFLEELISEQKIPEAISLFERHLDRLAKILRADFPMRRVKRTLERIGRPPIDLEGIAIQLQAADPETQRRNHDLISRLVVQARAVLALLSKMIPGAEKSQAAAATAIRSVVLSPDLTRYIASNRPYLAFRIFDLDLFENEEFLDSYVRALLANKGGPLYFEIKNNQNYESSYLYSIPAENPILHYFLGDPHIAENLGVYQPVGEFLLEELTRLGKDSTMDPYNDESENFREREAWSSPLFVAIRFFDIMLSRSLYHNVTWHMWLYYLPKVIEMMEKNYCPRVGIDLKREWPTKYHYLIYISVRILVDLVRALRDIPEHQENVILKSIHADHENGNIVKSSILALGQCMDAILCSDKLTTRFKEYLMEMVFNLYLKLRAMIHHQGYAEALLWAIKYGGPDVGRARKNSLYITTLRHIWNDADKVHFRNEDREKLEWILLS